MSIYIKKMKPLRWYHDIFRSHPRAGAGSSQSSIYLSRFPQSVCVCALPRPTSTCHQQVNTLLRPLAILRAAHRPKLETEPWANRPAAVARESGNLSVLIGIGKI